MKNLLKAIGLTFTDVFDTLVIFGLLPLSIAFLIYLLVNYPAHMFSAFFIIAIIGCILDHKKQLDRKDET